MNISKNVIILTVFLMVSVSVSIYYAGYLSTKLATGNVITLGASSKDKGKVIIEEFSDFQCSFCGKAQATMKQLKQRYGEKIETVFRHFPLEFHQYAEKAAEASECARDQKKFEQYSEILFKNQGKLDVEGLKLHATMLGLNTDNFNKCLESGAKAEIVQKDMEDGIAKGIDGTPAFFINGKKIVGAQPYEVFKSTIDAELDKQNGKIK